MTNPPPRPKELYPTIKQTITLHHKSSGQEITHIQELSDYNSMIQGYINFLRGIGVTVPEEEDRV